ncbi:MAG: glycoside hydrolase [bacterium]
MPSIESKYYRIAIIIFILLVSISTIQAKSWQELVFRNQAWAIAVDPKTFEVTAQPTGKPPIVISAPQPNLGEVKVSSLQPNRIVWEYTKRGIIVSLELNQSDLNVNIRFKDPGTCTWPVVQSSSTLQALIWPRWEGYYIPVKDTTWQNYLIAANDWDTLEGLSMPFWGLDYQDYIITYIITNPYNNTIRFQNENDTFQFQFTHEVTPNQHKKEYGFIIRLSDNSSPIEPAKQYRNWLIAQGKFVSMQDKLKSNPKGERLFGAPHVYLWGDNLFTRHDIYPNKWNAFCKKLVEQSTAIQPSPGKRIKELMVPEHWKEVEDISTMQWSYEYIKNNVSTELTRILQLPEFYDPISWQGIKVSDEVNAMLKRERKTLSQPELCRLNSLLLYAAYPEYMLQVADWGDGVSEKMLRQFQQAGFDRMVFCLDGWHGIEERPEVAVLADKFGYLFGTYDSFHSIHNPATRGTDASWETAQFDQALYETGPIIDKTGKKKPGFKKTGYLLSPIAARPYVEKRVRQNMQRVPYTYYFIDCDAYGEVFDDYSPLHPATQEDDATARVDRMNWISTTFHVVVGSEGGNAYAAPVIHIAEGMFGPGFGWGNPELNDKTSPYFLGAYYPPDGPKIFLQQVPIKERYRFFYYAPEFRLPLYETVFHDSVMATNHWSRSSLKFSNILETVALTELLYQVPPLYHLNLDEFKKQRQVIKRHYDFFSPLHRELGRLPMTEFNWLTPNRMVQRTVFGDKTELIANYSEASYEYQGTQIPGKSIMAKPLGSKEIQIYTPRF